jgi:hypothetical protein
MNPERRFSQLEEVIAEILQKQDRIEDLAIKTFSLAETANSNVETTARAVASLTLEVGEIKVDVKNIYNKVDQIQEGQQQIMTFLREKFS